MAEKVIYNLLSNNAPLNAIVPVNRIFGGTIPLGTALPAIAYNNVSGTQETAIGLTTLKRRARIQVTIASSDYKVLKQVKALVLSACNNKQGTFNNVVTDSVILELEGPDFRDDERNIEYQTLDFRITYNE
jgi:hypothetical protein